MSYRQAEKTGCLNAECTLKLFFKKFFCNSYEVKNNCCHLTASICFWMLSANYELLSFTLVTTATQRKHSTCQLLTTETKGEKGTSFGNFWDRGSKRRDVWVFQVQGIICVSVLNVELFRSFWFPSFWEKEMSSYLFLFFLKVFSVCTTPLTRRAASSMHKMKI